MFGKLALMGAASMLAYTGYAGIPFAAEQTASVEGTIYHYVRSNGEGARPEHVWVYRAAANQLEVYQTTARCADASFSNAWVSPTTGRASVITRGRLMPEARHEILASFNYDGTTGMLRGEAARNDTMAHGRIDIENANWHLKDLDLATVSVQTMALGNPQAGFSFALPGTTESTDLLNNPGNVNAEFVVAEDYRDTPALRFNVSGSALGEEQGTIWLDAASNHIVGAEWSDEESGYNLRLVGTDDGGESGWNALLARHYEGCITA